ncbi:MAG: hypothetical protein WKF57_10275 [Nakamurella sp.]
MTPNKKMPGAVFKHRPGDDLTPSVKKEHVVTSETQTTPQHTRSTVEGCPEWCESGTSCNGAHWRDVDGIFPSARRPGRLVVDNIGVYVHQDRERVPADRHPALMDAHPYVLMHLAGDDDVIDVQAHLTAVEARALAAIPLAAAPMLEAAAQ